MKTKTILGISIAAILTISVIAISTVPIALAKPDNNGAPDLIAILNDVGEHGDDLPREKGKAMFWIDGTGDDTTIKYKVVLNQVDVGEIGEDFNGKDGKKGAGVAHYVWKLHVHPLLNGEHDASRHLFNIVGPNDDEDLRISGNTLSGIWDEDDATNSKAHMAPHKTINPIDALDYLCNENSDVNVHLEETHLQFRGYVEDKSNACDNLGF
jgi:hypothetical protein